MLVMVASEEWSDKSSLMWCRGTPSSAGCHLAAAPSMPFSLPFSDLPTRLSWGWLLLLRAMHPQTSGGASMLGACGSCLT